VIKPAVEIVGQVNSAAKKLGHIIKLCLAVLNTLAAVSHTIAFLGIYLSPTHSMQQCTFLSKEVSSIQITQLYLAAFAYLYFAAWGIYNLIWLISLFKYFGDLLRAIEAGTFGI